MYRPRIDRDHALMINALTWAERSTCLRKQVGAVIAKDSRPISVGYNGAPSKVEHCTKETCNEEQRCKRTIHAEQNAILFAARHGISLEGASLYTTLEPCLDCAKSIINAGIKHVYYLELYGSGEGLELLDHTGVSIHFMGDSFDETYLTNLLWSSRKVKAAHQSGSTFSDTL